MKTIKRILLTGMALLFFVLFSRAENKSEYFNATAVPFEIPSFRKEKLTLIRDVPIRLEFYFTRADSEKLKEPKLVFEIPDDIQPEGFFCGENIRRVSWRRLNNNILQYTIHLATAVTNGLTVRMITGFSLVPSPDGESGNFELKWHLEDGNKIFPAKIIPCEILSFTPKDVSSLHIPFVAYCGIYEKDENSLIHIRKITRMLKAFGIKQVIGGFPGFGEIPRERNACEKNSLDYVGSFYYDRALPGFPDFIPDLSSPDNRTRDMDQKLYENSTDICPMLKIACDKAYNDGFLAKCAQVAREWPTKTFCWNYEPDCSNPECYCERCLKAFFQFVKKDFQPLKPKEIIGHYPNEWFRFVVWRQAEVMRVWTEAMRKARKDCVLIACSHALEINERDQQRQIERGRGDCRAYDQYIDMHMPMTYGHPVGIFNLTEKMTSEVRKPVVPVLGIWYCDSIPKPSLKLRPNELELAIFSALAAGGRGVAFFPGYTLYTDGAYLKAVNEAAANVLKVEPWLMSGKIVNTIRIEPKPIKTYPAKVGDENLETWFPDWKTLFRSRVFSLKAGTQDSFLVFLFNYSEKDDCYVRLKFPKMDQNDYTIMEPFKERLYAKSRAVKTWKAADLEKGIMYKVPPRDFTALTVEKTGQNNQFREEIYEEQINREYGEYLAECLIPSEYHNVILKTDGYVFLQSEIQTAVINQSIGGRIWDWNVKQQRLVKPEDNLVYGGFGGLCFDLFSFPGDVAWTGDEDEPYAINEIKENADYVSVTLERRVSNAALKGLSIVKTYEVYSRLPRITCNYIFRNESDKTIEFAFNSHHTPDIFSRYQTETCLSFPAKSGIVEKTEMLKNECIFPDGTESSPQLQTNSLCGNWIALKSKRLGIGIRIAFEKEKLEKINLLGRIEPPALNWEYKHVSLKPGDQWQVKLICEYLDIAQIKTECI